MKTLPKNSWRPL